MILIKTKKKFLKVIGYHQPNLSAVNIRLVIEHCNRTVYVMPVSDNSMCRVPSLVVHFAELTVVFLLVSFSNFVIVLINWCQDFMSSNSVCNHTCDQQLDSCFAVVHFVNHSYNYRPNWIPISLITIMNKVTGLTGS